MFGSLRSLWVFVDPISPSNNNIDSITYEQAVDEIILEIDTEQIIPKGIFNF